MIISFQTNNLEQPRLLLLKDENPIPICTNNAVELFMSTAQDGIMNNDNEKLQTALNIINLIKQKLGENYSSKENIERAERRAKSVMVTLKYRCNIGIAQCHAFCKCKGKVSTPYLS